MNNNGLISCNAVCATGDVTSNFYVRVGQGSGGGSNLTSPATITGGSYNATLAVDSNDGQFTITTADTGLKVRSGEESIELIPNSQSGSLILTSNPLLISTDGNGAITLIGGLSNLPSNSEIIFGSPGLTNTVTHTVTDTGSASIVASAGTTLGIATVNADLTLQTAGTSGNVVLKSATGTVNITNPNTLSNASLTVGADGGLVIGALNAPTTETYESLAIQKNSISLISNSSNPSVTIGTLGGQLYDTVYNPPPTQIATSQSFTFNFSPTTVAESIGIFELPAVGFYLVHLQFAVVNMTVFPQTVPISLYLDQVGGSLTPIVGTVTDITGVTDALYEMTAVWLVNNISAGATYQIIHVDGGLLDYAVSTVSGRVISLGNATFAV